MDREPVVHTVTMDNSENLPEFAPGATSTETGCINEEALSCNSFESATLFETEQENSLTESNRDIPGVSAPTEKDKYNKFEKDRISNTFKENALYSISETSDVRITDKVTSELYTIENNHVPSKAYIKSDDCIQHIDSSSDSDDLHAINKFQHNVDEMIMENKENLKENTHVTQSNNLTLCVDLSGISRTLEEVSILSANGTAKTSSNNSMTSDHNLALDDHNIFATDQLKKSETWSSTRSLDLVEGEFDYPDVLKKIPTEGTSSAVAFNAERVREIGRSAVSLNEHDINPNNPHISISRSTLCRSAENIVCLRVPTTDERDFKIQGDSMEKLNQEKVLAEFDAQKNKVYPLQKMSEHPMEISSEKFPRSHKDIITQDFGSIVKNVHGIFSSMSGSLKHAYNISQRAPAQKQININKLLTAGSLKNTTNGKIINNIFETDGQYQNESDSKRTATPETGIPNSNESSPKREEPNCEEIDSHKKFSIAEEDKLESLERALLAERLEVTALRDKVRQQAAELTEKEKERKDNECNFEKLRRRLEVSEREKDSAVMRYAVSERAVIGARDAAEAAKRAERAARAEVDLLAGKLKSAYAEKQRICQIYDDKCHEQATAERETARLKDELKECDGKLKWTQSKLRTEIDAYKEAAGQVERLTQQVQELSVSPEDSARVRELEAELSDARAQLTVARRDAAQLERERGELAACRELLAAADAAAALLRAQVAQLSSHNARLEEEAAELASLRARAALAATLADQLERETERARRAEEECARERARAETCARREASALEHAARLTHEHVGERAQHRRHEAEARALGADNAGLREQLSSLEVELTELRARLADEAAKRKSECQLLARKVAELTEEQQHSSKQLEWERGENLVLRKKHASAVKELNRELQRSLKRCEQLEARAEPGDRSTPTGSISSLSGSESPAAARAAPAALSAAASPAAAADARLNGHDRAGSAADLQQPDRQTLIERIVQLQRAGARRAERCDFLEEHNRQLTSELRDKARLLRQLLACQPAGALADSAADVHKREVARLGGGAMAAVWGGEPGGMTLELSLEINRKLQAVLEDALLKNITLKNNMDTLGAEIARLKAAKEST